MKKLLLLIVLVITTILSVQADEHNDNAETESVSDAYFDSSSETQTIGSGDKYVILHNSSELAFTIMGNEAKEFCKTNFGNHFTSIFRRTLGRYTAYFSCEMTNIIDQYDLSVEEKKCIELIDYEFKKCVDMNTKNAPIINAIKLQEINEKKYRTLDFINSVRTKFNDQIAKLEKNAENLRISQIKESQERKNQLKIQLSIQEEIDRLSEPLMEVLNRKKLQVEIDKLSEPLLIKLKDIIIQHNKETCIKYNFEVGSDWYNQCILNLISNQEHNFPQP